MKNVIDESMRDVEEIILSQTEPSTTDCRLEMKTALRYAYAPKVSKYKITLPSLPFRLQSVDRNLKSLSLTTAGCFSSEGSRLQTVQEMFKILNIKGAFLQMLHLHLASCRIVFDNCFTLKELLAYLNKRPRSLRSLSLLPSPKRCCPLEIQDCTSEAKYVKCLIVSYMKEKRAFFERLDAQNPAADLRSK
uniref:Uncharacterized protein n=1 Tax=Plectus sambesii TaxID=2011161 RepID=A0A914W8G8_9BILA